ncbi:MAG: hypothetical protein ACREBG_03500, partial [Pyrinomonadaceae bacterium]
MLNKFNLRIAQFASQEASRYTLTALLITSKATVATDGSSLVWVSVPSTKSEDFPFANFPAGIPQPSDTFTPFLLNADAAKAIEKVIPKESGLTILNHVAVSQEKDAEGRLQTALCVTDLETPQVFRPRPVSGTFPPYENLFSSKKPLRRVAVSARYLARIAKFAAEFSARGEGMDALYISIPQNEKDPIRFDCHRDNEEQGMSALLMPMRAGE